MRRTALLSVLFTAEAMWAANSLKEVTFTAELVTISGTPFGLTGAKDRLRILRGKFVYDLSTRDTDTTPHYGRYQLNQAVAAFSGTLAGTVPVVFTGSGTANIEVSNSPAGASGDYFRFADGPDGPHPKRYMQVNGVQNTNMTLWFHHQSAAGSMVESDALPDPYNWGTGLDFPHTFAIGDGNNGSALFQLRAMGTSANQGLLFVPSQPCRLLDTRPAGTLSAGETRTLVVRNLLCDIPSEAVAFSLNATVVPKGQLGYVTLFPTGQNRPEVSNLNSLDGRVKANAVVVKGGQGGTISVYATDATDLILDINGYFVPPAPGGLYFYPLPPCRVLDTRSPNGPLGGPRLGAQQSRTVPVMSTCGVPLNARAYSLNATVVPNGPFGFLTLWPSGRPRPTVSTLNAVTGTVVANAAIVPAGTGGSIDVYGSEGAHLVLDINGYFAPEQNEGNPLKYYSLDPCRLLDSRTVTGQFTGLPWDAGRTIRHTVEDKCGITPDVAGVALNATVVPTGTFGFLTLFPSDQQMPVVSTLNAIDGAITSNLAIVPSGTAKAVNSYVTDKTHLILDVMGFFAP